MPELRKDKIVARGFGNRVLTQETLDESVDRMLSKTQLVASFVLNVDRFRETIERLYLVALISKEAMMDSVRNVFEKVKAENPNVKEVVFTESGGEVIISIIFWPALPDEILIVRFDRIFTTKAKNEKKNTEQK